MVFWRMFRRRDIYLLLVLLVAGLVVWWFMIQMPGKNSPALLALTPEEIALRGELVSDVQTLAGQIGERNFRRYKELMAASDFIEKSFSMAGLPSRRDTYKVQGANFDNIEAEIKGTRSEILLVGAHYDSVLGSPGANDNGSGVAALLALARRFAGKPCARTVRFVAFVNEEPPMFQAAGEMGSYVYAGRCRASGDRIEAMMSLETIGYYSNALHSQRYPLLGLGLLYPTTGNFVGFVGNVSSRALVREAIGQFRRHAQVPAQGAAMPSIIPGVGWSDQWAFWQHGYPGIMITDTAPFRYPHYHAASDTPDKLDYDTMARVVQGLEKVIDHLARSDSR